ncbi:Dihydrouridine synthase (Dus) [Novymonas esmeraldas]|uniref:Dihydrouridine synthase (Dus) n=1 Tax=Novymonas esmeraldas TaxID=1808958 RepID=A0AAW0F569_9TRYP
MGEDWAPYELAWSQDPLHRPRHVHLPALIEAADKAVAEAVASLSRDDSSGASPASASHAAPSECDGDAVHDWWGLYTALCFIQAPMVRCSRPAFRRVCREWGTRISYTHMLIAESFVKSAHARHAELARYAGEDRLVVQLAAKSGPAAAEAARLLRPYCDAVDLNCGCPQRWAMKEGIGAALLDRPEQVADMVHSIRNAVPDGHTDAAGAPPPVLPCVVKMRIKDDLRHSVDFARQCEAAGASWLTVHGRTPTCQPSAAVNAEAVTHIRECLSVPVVLNGGVADVSTAMEAALRTGCGGLMAANGLLDNPAMFYCAPSRAAMEAEMTFATSDSEAAPLPGAAAAFSPVQRVSFAWAPDRAAPAVQLRRYSVHDMWQASVTPREVISDFVRAAIRTDLAVPTTVQQVLRMARVYVSPAERNHLALLRSNLSVLRCLQEVGVYVEGGRIACV